MATIAKYEEWVSELERGKRPAELSHIGTTVGGAARCLRREIESFEWPASERAQAQELAARAKAVGLK